MSAGMIAALVAAYFLLAAPRNGAARAPAPAPAAPAGGAATPAGTFIRIPGIGEYANIYGGGVSVTLDPRLFGGGGAAPQREPVYHAGIAAPQLSAGYIPEAEMDAPIALLPPTPPPWWPARLASGIEAV